MTKKILYGILLLLLNICAIQNVNAALAYGWIIDGENITYLEPNNKNKSGTVTWEMNNDYTGGTLTLNNYNGGQIQVNCFGSGLPNMVFAIKLVGDNTITTENGSGIINGSLDFNASIDIIFIGDGTLTINADNPIEYIDSVINGVPNNIIFNKNNISNKNDTKINNDKLIEEDTNSINNNESNEEVTKINNDKLVEENTNSIDNNKEKNNLINNNESSKKTEKKNDSTLYLIILVCTIICFTIIFNKLFNENINSNI